MRHVANMAAILISAVRGAIAQKPETSESSACYIFCRAKNYLRFDTKFFTIHPRMTENFTKNGIVTVPEKSDIVHCKSNYRPIYTNVTSHHHFPPCKTVLTLTYFWRSRTLTMGEVERHYSGCLHPLIPGTKTYPVDETQALRCSAKKMANKSLKAEFELGMAEVERHTVDACIH